LGIYSIVTSSKYGSIKITGLPLEAYEGIDLNAGYDWPPRPKEKGKEERQQQNHPQNVDHSLAIVAPVPQGYLSGEVR
jgi:hypothetical protein